MRKKTIRFLAIILVVSLLLPSYISQAASKTYKGKFGSNITWTLSNNVLTISGKGVDVIAVSTAHGHTKGVGESVKLSMKNTEQKVLLRSSKNHIAFVDGKGVLTARKKGKAVISTKINGKTVKITVTVTE